jgi:hypothetical protein
MYPMVYAMVITVCYGCSDCVFRRCSLCKWLARMLPKSCWSQKQSCSQGLIYFYESVADVKAQPLQEDSYPTILHAMQAALHDGKSVVVDADVNAVRGLRASNIPACYIFILPASMEKLRENVTESMHGASQAEIEAAIAKSEREVLAVDEDDLYDFGVQNDDDGDTLAEISNLAETRGKLAAEVRKTIIDSHCIVTNHIFA